MYQEERRYQESRLTYKGIKYEWLKNLIDNFKHLQEICPGQVDKWIKLKERTE